jgi:hypothetical protein
MRLNYERCQCSLRIVWIKRGIDYFFTEGNKVENEVFANPYTERAKELLKKHGKPDVSSF